MVKYASDHLLGYFSVYFIYIDYRVDIFDREIVGDEVLIVKLQNKG